ncbi:peptidyl-prolyl cis-trans isomerase [Cohnella hashimotonis]|uniref:peptidylprolyl isomerase n=1 Tax=Cohnella hashimotonis TaxID=2826895 RepID=A0ABT6TK83_9BACL|nr:peptidyl-prolyl cis-trans isomerase [Cohnella hashimotonis]MDI4647256.1 peptidylprolyl isomerase [Cohnella hashimotonis]
MKKWLTVGGLAVFIAIVLFAVYAYAGADGAKPDAGAPKADARESASIVATVGKTNITKDELYEAMLRQVGAQTLQEMVIRQLADEQAAAKGLTVGGEELEAGMEKMRGSFASETEFQSYLSSVGLDEAGFAAQIKMQLQIGKLFASELKVTDEQISQFYELNEASFHHPAQVRLSHILVKTEDQAKELYGELAKGADFAKLAAEFSADVATREAGGDLGYLSAGQTAPELEQAAGQLKTGAYSKPVKTAYGYHLLKLTDRKPASTETADQAKDRIVELIRQQRLNELVPQWLASFTASGEVTVRIPNPNPGADTEGAAGMDGADAKAAGTP